MSSPRLEGEIRRAMGLEPTVNINNVQVQVVDGVATLSGIVTTLEEKETAGRTAARVAGVRQVENRLAVTTNHARTDRHLTEELDAALEALPDDERRTVGAVSVGGVAHLVGHADSASVVAAAHQAASGVEGVREIINEVQIDAGAPMDEASVINRVAQALVQAGLLRTSNIKVEAEGGEVVLHGRVDNPEERARAEEIARTVAGVSQVENRLTVAEIAQPRPEGVTFR